jgi:hypothetical protein
MDLVVTNFGYNAGGWRVEKHPRFLADLTSDHSADIVGFGDDGVWVALNNGNGMFAAPQRVVTDFGYNAGGWRVERHPRFLADLTGDGRADIVGFGDDGVHVSLNNGNGTFAAPQLVIANFGYNAGGWRVEKHPRFLADLTGDGRADIVGFGQGGVWVALNNGNGTFAAPQLALANFGYNAGAWRLSKHLRFLADLTGDGRADIVGFGDDGVQVSLNNGNGGFAAPQLVVANFGYTAGSWRVTRHPRFLADLTGDGRADIVGFGDDGVQVSLNNGNGTFAAPQLVVTNFGYTAGTWRVDQHPRFLANLTSDRSADIVGFGNEGVWTSLNNGNGTFAKGFVRKDIWALEAGGPWDPVTLAYAKAIKVLQSRPATNPTSWTYLSAVHGTTASVPPGAVWNQCQHGSWWFLPWHRMYIYYFERIIRAEVIKAGGPSDWALPFWDYEQGGHASLPPAFRQPTMPDGTANPLFVTQRSGGMNAGAQLPSSATSSAAAMAFTAFTPPPSPGFGGGKTSPQHFFGATGELEFTPHNIVHSLIGGWMGDPDRAASDPIFWLHHCNIDRLWEVWLKKAGGRANPTDAQWRTTPFTFHDEAGAQVQLTATDILNTAAQLGYTYQGVTAGAVASLGVAEGADEGQVADEVQPDMVGASERPTVLMGADATVDIVIDQRTLTERAVSAADTIATPARVYLSIEDVEAERNPETGYEVYISVPDKPGAVPQYIGNVSFFGIQHLSGARGSGDDASHGFRRVFDITKGVEALRRLGVWDDSLVRVSFRPVSLIMPPSAEEAMSAADVQASEAAKASPVSVGRVSLHYG